MERTQGSGSVRGVYVQAKGSAAVDIGVDKECCGLDDDETNINFERGGKTGRRMLSGQAHGIM